MQPHIMAADRLEDGVGAHDIGVDEGPGVVEGIIVVRLRGEMDHQVTVADQLIHQGGVADVAFDEAHLVLGQPGEVCSVARVRQLVNHSDRVTGVMRERVPHKIRPDEPGSTGNQHSCHAFTLYGQLRCSAGRAQQARRVDEQTAQWADDQARAAAVASSQGPSSRLTATTVATIQPLR